MVPSPNLKCHVDFSNLCRICVSFDKTEYINVFSNTESNISYADIINQYTSMKVVKSDELPIVICKVCAVLAEQLLAFQELCVKSDNKFQEFIARLKEQNLDNNETCFSDTKSNECETGETFFESNNTDTHNEEKDLTVIELVTVSTKEVQLIKNVPDKSKNLPVEDTTCNACNRKFMSMKLLNRHKSIVHEKEVYKCTSCKKCFSLKRALHAHIRRVHTDASAFRCEECGKRFNTKSNLDRHKLIHSGEHPFSCSDCPATFVQKVQLQDHIRRHHTFEKPFACSACAKRYVAIGDLKRHQETRHLIPASETQDGKLICGVCDSEFFSASEYQSHKNSHTSINNLCSECGRCFTTKRSLQSHQEVHKDKTVECDECRKSFASERKLLIHKKTHAPKKYLCNHCGKKYSTKWGLNLHLNFHSGDRPFACFVENCEKAFRSKSSLKLHLCTHTKEKKYSCEVCGKKFTQNGHLFYHRRLHSGVKPFTCSLCNKSFAVRSSFNAHINRHRGDKTSICDVCKEGFFDASSLSKHKKRAHPFEVLA